MRRGECRRAVSLNLVLWAGLFSGAWHYYRALRALRSFAVKPPPRTLRARVVGLLRRRVLALTMLPPNPKSGS